ncbi:LysM peptidoglycan-binding domain-containing protein [Fodinicurvata fenggangensis]|uniref:LysM peptidoglycan-binding domain-containing protein n=1 Tax=Fodinicurvata fenggangensis TaxID=1121830 RepID=UPI0009DD658A|nr:LysM peptidoglycan-binding domain-containing protein [Fodinicurvata fenggangensis]
MTEESESAPAVDDSRDAGDTMDSEGDKSASRGESQQSGEAQRDSPELVADSVAPAESDKQEKTATTPVGREEETSALPSEETALESEEADQQPVGERETDEQPITPDSVDETDTTPVEAADRDQSGDSPQEQGGAESANEVESEIAASPEPEPEQFGTEEERQEADSQVANGPDKVLPSFDVVRVERDGSFVAAGRAAAGSQVSVLANGEEIASVQADQRGEWVLLPDEGLISGDHELSLSSVSGNGAHADSKDIVVVSVPSAASSRALDSGQSASGGMAEEVTDSSQVQESVTDSDTKPLEALSPRPLAVQMPREGAGEARVLQGPEGGLIAGELSLDSITYDEDGELLASGQLVPGARVFMYVNDRFVGEAKASENGRWQIQPDKALEGGKYTIRIDQVDEEGEVVARLETPFVREEISPDQAEGGEVVVVQPGNSLWRLARRSYGRGIHYTVIYDANDDQIQDPDLIYPGQVFVVPGIEEEEAR